MILIAGSVPIRPDRREAAARAACAMAEATRAEPGCIAYAFAADLDDPNTFRIFEEWASEEALGRHFASPHMRVFREQIPELVAGPARLHRYTVADKAAM